MDYNKFISDYRKNKSTKNYLPADFGQRVDSCKAVQIHSTGARPAFTLNGLHHKPETYNKKFDELFAYRLLNRHPNEHVEHYNWRLSVYAPIGKELFDRFLEMCRGSILQPNNFSFSGDEKTQELVSRGMLYNAAFEGIEFVLNNPRGYMAVIESEHKEKDQSESMLPKIVYIKSEDILQIDDESVCFQYGKKLVYINNEIQIVDELKTPNPITTVHNFGTMPFWAVDSSFTQPFVIWAENLVRNMNDDEAMTKHYSYPSKSVVSPECNTCHGMGYITQQIEGKLEQKKLECASCHGKGVMSINPGEHHTFSEEKLSKFGGQMPEMVRFTTPDVGIPQYHLDRWQVFYERAEKSLFLSKKINGTESGDAKKEDRKDQYYFLMSISNFVFENIKHALYYVSAYLNYRGGKYESQPFVLVPPKQFDLMTDSDLVNEFTTIQTKTDDNNLLAELCFAVNAKVFRDDPIQVKINDVMYYIDPLYGVSGVALRAKLLSGIYSDFDKTIHEKGYLVLKNYAREIGSEAFTETNTDDLIEILRTRVNELIPSGIYNE